MTAIVKPAVERLVGSGPLGYLGRRRHRGRVLVLSYHNVVPDDAPVSGDASLHLPIAKFRAHLDRLQATHRVVSLRDALDPADRGRPRVVITFDDAYRGALGLGCSELARRGLPATVFVVPGLVGAEGFWWDRFVPDGGWPPELRDALLTRGRGEERAAVEWALGQGLDPRPVGPWHRVASEAELDAAAATGLVTFGSHSWDHPNLAALTEPEIEWQLDASIGWLRNRYPGTLEWVAYPYGLHSSTVHRVAERLGFVGGLAVSGGWWPDPPADRYALPRWNVPAGISVAGLQVRAAGYWCR